MLSTYSHVTTAENTPRKSLSLRDLAVETKDDGEKGTKDQHHLHQSTSNVLQKSLKSETTVKGSQKSLNVIQ